MGGVIRNMARMEIFWKFPEMEISGNFQEISNPSVAFPGNGVGNSSDVTGRLGRGPYLGNHEMMTEPRADDAETMISKGIKLYFRPLVVNPASVGVEAARAVCSVCVRA